MGQRNVNNGKRSRVTSEDTSNIKNTIDEAPKQEESKIVTKSETSQETEQVTSVTLVTPVKNIQKYSDCNITSDAATSILVPGGDVVYVQSMDIREKRKALDQATSQGGGVGQSKLVKRINMKGAKLMNSNSRKQKTKPTIIIPSGQ